MHISEGVLSIPVLAAGAAITVAGLAIGIRKVPSRELPKIALLTAAFFVASLVHVPIGPSNAHLVLNGLLGVLLGWAAFPAIFIGLVLQAVLFQFGGLTTLGVNTANMAIPGVVFGLIARRFLSLKMPTFSAIVAGLAGGMSILGSGLLVAISLGLSGDSFSLVSRLIFTAHLPIALVEAFITGFSIRFLLRVRPEMVGCTSPLRREESAKKTLNAALVALVAFLMIVPQGAQAHRVNLFAWFDGENIVGRAYYSNGRPAIEAALKVKKEGFRESFRLKTDKEGRFSFTPKGPGNYELVLEAGQGHMAKAYVQVKFNETLKTGKGSNTTQSKADAKAAFYEEKERPLNKNAVIKGVPGSLKKCQDMEKTLDRLLIRRLEPIRRELEALAVSQSRVTLKDVISGVGYIWGIVGIWAYLLSRREK